MSSEAQLPISCVVLEDDLLIRELVGSFVEQVEALRLEGLYDNPLTAFEHLARQPTDLLITDIEMPRLSGLELVRSLRQPPLVIFITSHRQYAAQTYDLDAVDYLVKPLTLERFLRAVDKAQLMFRTRRSWEQGPTSISAAPGPPAGLQAEAPALEAGADFFFIRTEFQFVKLRYADVVYIEAMRDFTKIHLVDGTVHITLVNLKNIEEQLPEDQFVRTHRSFLVNTTKIEVVTNQDVKVYKFSVPLGLTFRDAVTERVVQSRLITRRKA